MPDNQNQERLDENKPVQKPYENPGKDKDHPGDRAANKSATEPSKGEPAGR